MELPASSSSIISTAAGTPTVSSVYLTLPLACQVCLGKVKDPVVCPNQHVFCSSCMTTWLKSSQTRMCPTCRVPITDKQPCKRIIGSMDCSPTAHDKSVKEQMRKTRFEVLYQEYEIEIKSLEQQLEESQTENHHIKEINNDLKSRLESTELRLAKMMKTGNQEKSNGDAVTQDINTILKLSSRLQDMINYNKVLKEENETYKMELRDVKRQKDSLKEEVDKLIDASKYAKSPQRFSRYTVAALQTKVDNYEREVLRLRRALERSDEYVDELKRRVEHQPNSADFPASDNINPSGSVENGQNDAEQTTSVGNAKPQASRIDEFANIALATRHLPVEGSDFNESSILQRKSPSDEARIDQNPFDEINALSRLATKYTSYDTDGQTSSTAGAEDQGARRSIFEDTSKFPACAKLIELTKFRRETSDRCPTDSSSTDVNAAGASGDNREGAVQNSERSSLLSTLLQQRESVPSPLSAAVVGCEGSAFSVVGSNHSARLSYVALNSQSPQSATQTDSNHMSDLPAQNSPPSLLKLNYPTMAHDDVEDGDPSDPVPSSSYPCSIVLQNNRMSSEEPTNDDYDVLSKRIKIEKTD